MPEYVYKHPKKEQYIELVQSVNDEHIFYDEDGLKWDRVYSPINFSTHSKIDAFDTNIIMIAIDRAKSIK